MGRWNIAIIKGTRVLNVADHTGSHTVPHEQVFHVDFLLTQRLELDWTLYM